MTTPQEFRQAHNLSPDQFKRLKRKVEAANPGVALTERVGASWEIISPELFTAHLSPSEPTSEPSDLPSDSPSSALVTRPVALAAPEVVTAEVVELTAYVPDYSAQIDRALLEIQHSNQVASGNANLINQAELQAAVAQGVAQAHAIHAATEKAKQAALAQLQQQQLNAMGLGQSSPAQVQAPASQPAVKK